MAELNSEGGGGKHHKGGKRSKKISTRIDMTPMVDLGFLLITFFILATTLAKPTTMEINMPVKDPTIEPPPVKASRTVTVILGKYDKIYWYNGENNPPAKVIPVLNTVDFGPSGIRKVLMDEDKRVRTTFTMSNEKDKGVIVLIKPLSASKYKNVVDILDEMKIAGIYTYAIVDVAPEDYALLSSNNVDYNM